MELIIKIDFPTKRLTDLLVNCIEGNHMTRAWCDGIYLTKKEVEVPADAIDPEYNLWYTHQPNFEKPFVLEVHEIAGIRGQKVRHKITEKEIIEGFERLSKSSEYAHHFSAIMKCEEDNITADVWLQMVVLKDVVYG